MNWLIKLKVVTKKLNHRKCKAQQIITQQQTNQSFHQLAPLRNAHRCLRNISLVAFSPSLLSDLIHQTLAALKIQKKHQIREVKLEDLTENTHSNKNKWQYLK